MSLTPYKDAVLATAGIISLWPLGEESGAVATDAKAVSNGAYIAAPLLHQDSLLVNQEGASVKFNGTSQYVNVPDNAALRIADTFSLEAWLISEGIGAYSIFSGQNGSAELAIVENKIFLNKKEVVQIAASTAKISEGVRHHIVVTKTGATVKFYVDGAEVAIELTNATCESHEGAWHLCRNGTREEAYLKGRLQYAAMYNVALTKAKVEEHFAAREAAVTSPTFPIPHAHRGLIMSGRSLS